MPHYKKRKGWIFFFFTAEEACSVAARFVSDAEFLISFQMERCFRAGTDPALRRKREEAFPDDTFRKHRPVLSLALLTPLCFALFRSLSVAQWRSESSSILQSLRCFRWKLTESVPLKFFGDY